MCLLQPSRDHHSTSFRKGFAKVSALSMRGLGLGPKGRVTDNQNTTRGIAKTLAEQVVDRNNMPER